MPRTSATYHLDARRLWVPPGRLVHVDCHDGGLDVYIRPGCARPELVRDLNQVSRQHVGYGLWRLPLIGSGLLLRDDGEPAVMRWENVPADKMPRGRWAIPVEEEGACVWLIRDGSCVDGMIPEMNATFAGAIAGGVWLQNWWAPMEPAMSASRL